MFKLYKDNFSKDKTTVNLNSFTKTSKSMHSRFINTMFGKFKKKNFKKMWSLFNFVKQNKDYSSRDRSLKCVVCKKKSVKRTHFIKLARTDKLLYLSTDFTLPIVPKNSNSFSFCVDNLTVSLSTNLSSYKKHYDSFNFSNGYDFNTTVFKKKGHDFSDSIILENILPGLEHLDNLKKSRFLSIAAVGKVKAVYKHLISVTGPTGIVLYKKNLNGFKKYNNYFLDVNHTLLFPTKFKENFILLKFFCKYKSGFLYTDPKELASPFLFLIKNKISPFTIKKKTFISQREHKYNCLSFYMENKSLWYKNSYFFGTYLKNAKSCKYINNRVFKFMTYKFDRTPYTLPQSKMFLDVNK